ncbi:MAG: beta strand repeat-containing protein [Gemmataceae bacterium]
MEERAVPTATLISAPNVTTIGGTTSVQIAYSETTTIDFSTINTSNITVSGGPGVPITINSATPSPASGSATTVTYTFTPPAGGTWGLTNRGSYTVDFNGGVSDTTGFTENAQSGIAKFVALYRDGNGQLAVSDNSADVDDGDWSTGKVTLREAVNMANLLDGADTVNFTGLTTPATITLGGTEIKGTGAPVTGSTPNSLTITGPDATNPSKIVIDGALTSRIFEFTNTNTTVTATFTVSNLVMQNGNSGASDGGAVLIGPSDGNVNHITALFDHVQILTSTSANEGGGIGVGFYGATANAADKVTVQFSTISGNTALTGGGMYFGARGNLVITASTINNNTAAGGVGGGGVYFWGNVNSSVVITNSTIAGNSTDLSGGGVSLFNFDGSSASIRNSTITGNTANGNNSPYYGGGGVYVDFGTSGTGSLNIQSSVVGGNTDVAGAKPDIYSGASGGFAINITKSFLGVRDKGFTATSIDTVTTNISGTSTAPLAPALYPLFANGGPTLTFLPKNTAGPGEALLLNKGYNPDPANITTDQRGQVRSFGTPDIGSVEIVVAGAPTGAVVSAPNITVSGGNNPYTFTVKYTDDVAIKASTVGAGDIRVTGPGGFSQVATFVSAVPGNVSPGNDSPSIVATYTITPNTLGSANWDYLDNGSYDINLEPNQITDTSNNAAPDGSVGTFTVTAPRPSAKMNAPSPAIGATSETFTVTYTGTNTKIANASIGNGDVVVTGPGGFSATATLVGASPGTDSTTIVATYSVPSPIGGFQIANRGLYVAQVQPNQVLDVDGSSVDSVNLGGFTFGLVVDEVSDVNDADFSAGKLSIREALFLSNQTTAAETITFDSTTFGTAQTIALNSELPVNDNTTITGTGVALLTINANNGTDNNRRIFNVSPTAASTVSITNMTLTNGGPSSATIGINQLGGAIFGNASVNLTLDKMAFTNNTAGFGGAIVVRTGSTLNITNSSFTSNTANWTVTTAGGYINGGGAISITDPGVNVSISNTTFTNNVEDNITGGSTGGGGAIDIIANTNVTMNNVSFTGNISDGAGGAFTHRGSGNILLNNCSFTNNTATGAYGGGIDFDQGGTATSIRTLTDVSFNNNWTQSTGNGAGAGVVVFGDGQFTFLRNSFTNNTAGVGGGGLQISLQTAGNNTITVDSSLFANNWVQGGLQGGAIATASYGTTACNLTIRNSTMTGNTAGFGGAIRMYANTTGTVNIQNSTIANNTATTAGQSGGIRRTGGTLTLESTVVSGSYNLSDAALSIDLSSSVAIPSAKNCLVQTKGTQAYTVSTGSIFNVNPLLGALANNGGPLQTMRPLAGSPLINAGSNPAGLATDARGAIRSVGITDIGAVEVQALAQVTSVVLDEGTGNTNINGVNGTTQRSEVRRIIVTFNQPVSFSGATANAFTLARSNASLSPGTFGNVTLNVTPATTPAGSPTSSVTITFSGTFADSTGSLVDGLYNFNIDATQVSNFDTALLDGDGDNTAGGNYTRTGTTANKWYRFYGDQNADGGVDQSDYLVFRNALSGGPNTVFDSNNDNDVDQTDYLRFRQNLSGAP